MATTEKASAFIARHQTGCDAAFLAERLAAEEQLFETGWTYLPGRPVNISAMFKDALDAAGWRAALKGDDPLLRRDLERVARCGSAMAAMITPGQGAVAVDLGTKPTVQVPRLAHNDVLTPIKLRQALFAAMICRDRQAIEGLCGIDVRGLQVPGVIIDDYAFTFVEFLQGMLTRAPGVGGKIVRAMEETDPDALKTGNVDYALNIAVGEIDCFYGLGAGAMTTFNERLAKAIERHKQYYGRVEVDGVPQRNDPRGFIALGPLAAAALAHDHGRTITLQSDYLPPSLIYRKA